MRQLAQGKTEAAPSVASSQWKNTFTAGKKEIPKQELGPLGSHQCAQGVRSWGSHPHPACCELALSSRGCVQLCWGGTVCTGWVQGHLTRWVVKIGRHGAGPWVRAVWLVVCIVALPA